MKRTLIPLALLAFTALALAQSGGTLKSVNSTNELVMLNPRSGNTNVLVHSMPWLSSSFWTWHEGDTTGPDTNHLDSVLYPGLGRWVWNNIGTNYFQTLVVSNLVGSAGSLWTNDAGILRPIDLTLPVMLTNQLQFGPGTTNVISRSGSNVGYTNGALDVKFTVLNGLANGASLEAQSQVGFLATAGGATSVGLRALTHQVTLDSVLPGFRPVVDLSEDSGLMKYAWRTNVVQHSVIRGFEEGSGSPNHSILDISQASTNDPVVFDQITAGTAGYSRGFSFRTNGVEVFNVTGSGGPSSGANWVTQTNVSSMLAGTAFFGASARTNWVDQVNITSPMVSAWVTDNGDPSRMQPYWQVSKDGVWNKLAATFYIDLATNFLHFGGTADNGATNGPWFSFNARNDIPFTQLDLGQSWNNSFFHLDPFATAGPNFWFTVATNNTSDTILAITNLTTRVMGLKTNGDLTLAGKISAEGNYVLENDGNGASVVGMIPVYTDTTGRKVTPTNTLSSLSIANLTGTNWGADLVPYFDANTNLQTSATTTAELGFLHGVTSDIQGQLNGKKDDFDLVRSVGFSVDGGGSAISPGKVKGFFTVPFSGTIQAWNITVDTGTATVKVWKIATGTAKPTAANSINTSGIAIAANTHIHSTTLTDFTTTTVTAGDIIAFNIEAVASATELSGSIEILQN